MRQNKLVSEGETNLETSTKKKYKDNRQIRQTNIKSTQTERKSRKGSIRSENNQTDAERHAKIGRQTDCLRQFETAEMSPSL